DAQVFQLAARHQGRIPRLCVAGPGEDLSRVVETAVDARPNWRPSVVTPPGECRRDAVVAIDAADLLDQVLGYGDVEPENRWQHVPLPAPLHLDVEVEPLEDRLRVFERDVRAEHLVDQRRPEIDANRLLRPRVDVRPLAMHLATGQLGDQRRGAACTRQRELGWQRTLKASRGFGTKSQRTRGLPHAGAVEV